MWRWSFFCSQSLTILLSWGIQLMKSIINDNLIIIILSLVGYPIDEIDNRWQSIPINWLILTIDDLRWWRFVWLSIDINCLIGFPIIDFHRLNTLGDTERQWWALPIWSPGLPKNEGWSDRQREEPINGSVRDVCSRLPCQLIAIYNCFCVVIDWSSIYRYQSISIN